MKLVVLSLSLLSMTVAITTMCCGEDEPAAPSRFVYEIDPHGPQLRFVNTEDGPPFCGRVLLQAVAASEVDAVLFRLFDRTEVDEIWPFESCLDGDDESSVLQTVRAHARSRETGLYGPEIKTHVELWPSAIEGSPCGC